MLEMPKWLKKLLMPWTWIWRSAQLALGLLVLFHTYTTEDMAIVVALLVMLYGMITAQISIEGAASALYFTALAKRVRKEQDEGDVEFAAAQDLPHLFIGSVFSLALAFIAGIKLLVALFV
jgi:hypothetical protein